MCILRASTYIHTVVYVSIKLYFYIVTVAADSQRVTERGDGVSGKVATSSPSKLSESSQISAWENFKSRSKSEKDLNIPRRQNPMKAGTKGQRIRVLTNMFEIIFDKNFADRAVHYNVKVTAADIPVAQSSSKKTESKIKRELKNKTLLRKIFEVCRTKHFPSRYPAFDGMSNAFAAKKLPFENTVSNKQYTEF